MDNDLPVDPLTQDRIIAEAVRRGRRRRRRWRLMGAAGVLALAAGGTAVALAVAGGPPTQQVTTANPAVAPTTSSPAPSTKASAPPSKAPATSVGPRSAACRSGQLRISVSPYGYGMGEGAAQISYVNTSATGCTLEGYPAVTVSSQSGKTSISAKPTAPGRYLENQNLGAYPPAPVAVTLPSGAGAVSYIGWDGGASLPANRLSDCVTGPWVESVVLPGGGGVVVSDGDLGLGVCSNLEAEPIQAATYHPGP